MGWVKTGTDFPNRRLIVVVDATSTPAEAMFHGGQVEVVEALARGLIVAVRPDLGGATLGWLAFDYARRAFEIGIEHPRLAEVARGREAPRVPLEELAALDLREEC